MFAMKGRLDPYTTVQKQHCMLTAPSHFMRRETYCFFQVQQTRCNITQFIYFYENFYMFQAVPPTIIRSPELYIQYRVLCQTFFSGGHHDVLREYNI